MEERTTNTSPRHIGKHNNNLAPKWSWAYEKQRGRWEIILPISILAISLCYLLINPIAFNPKRILILVLYSFSALIAFMAVLRLLAILISARTVRQERLGNITETVIPIRDWPRFCVLVPLYQEAHMVESLMHHLSLIDYPKDKLDIYLVTEADDLPTCQAVKKHLRAPFHIYAVPPSQPRTKPKALNATLASIPADKCGDIITIYDAEDRPHPGQLKQAALRFLSEPGLAALQAPLGYYNDRDNLLTAQFGLEYAALFHVWNPALAKLGLPFTLGGTSNHIRRDILELCGGWDADNVTEDADLSFRIFALCNTERKAKIGTIDFPTDEEAVSTHKDWTAQRSRWLKGFMQTWHVHMRAHKYAPDGTHLSFLTRIKITFALQITIGATLMFSFLHVPSLLVMFGLFCADLLGLITIHWPLPLLGITALGYSAAILSGLVGVLRAGKPHLIKHAVLMPFYWLLYFRAALIAAYEIVVAPTHWRKTTHAGTHSKSQLTAKTSPVSITTNRALER